MFIPSTDSTNNLIKSQYLDREDLFTVYTDFQTAGRGQQGNGWESERGKNLLFSTLLRDWHIPVSRQFLLNQIVSLSLYRAVLPLLTDDQQPLLSVKWPNDLYFADRKLAGILIENFWQGNQIARSVVGIGLNVNQTVFLSPAPNPVSLYQITGITHDRDQILHRFLQNLRRYHTTLIATATWDAGVPPAAKNNDTPTWSAVVPARTSIPRPQTTRNDTPTWSAVVPARTPESGSNIASSIEVDYMRVLYRRDGWYLWEEREVSSSPSMPQMQRNNCQFQARIHSVLPSGELVLQTADNSLHTYHFKQIRYVL